MHEEAAAARLQEAQYGQRHDTGSSLQGEPQAKAQRHGLDGVAEGAHGGQRDCQGGGEQVGLVPEGPLEAQLQAALSVITPPKDARPRWVIEQCREGLGASYIPGKLPIRLTTALCVGAWRSRRT